MAILSILAGLVLLVVGGDLLVRWSSKLALGLGIPSLVVGLTVVAFGTSAPELAVSLAAAWNGAADIAVGNVVGSNIFNVLCVLGGSGLLSSTPIPVSAAAMAFDIPFMVAIMFLCVPVFLTHGHISRIEGILFLALYGGYTALLVLFGAGATTRGVPWLAAMVVLTLGVVVWEIVHSRRTASRG